MRYEYIIDYEGSLLRDSEESFETMYLTEDEAMLSASLDIESYIYDWEIDGVEYDKSLFNVQIKEVK